VAKGANQHADALIAGNLLVSLPGRRDTPLRFADATNGSEWERTLRSHNSQKLVTETRTSPLTCVGTAGFEPATP
jgi:hypothetical protein